MAEALNPASGVDAKLWASVVALRAKSPLVQCLTNYPSMDIMANGLLAIGASPAMVHATEELPDAVAVAGAIGAAVCVNIGTLDERWVESFKVAVGLCKEHSVPWVLDPVAAGFTKLRTRTAVELMELHPPAVVRGNASEIMSISPTPAATEAASGGKGVDTMQSSEAALDAAKRLAKKYGLVVVVSGEVDYIVSVRGDGFLVSSNPHGHELMTKVTAVGCLVNAVIAAFVASKPAVLSVHEAAAMAFAYFTRCGELAAPSSKGPATFRVTFIDTLYSVSEADLAGSKLVIDTGL
eukprot:CAMPEP_0171093632 /NCGR_PEP_ID=MMETSP0766_2-20121228/39195_1 /TAXON_ID=439317 /ORGANISM="Gambierdiscus australes, Strain CAWD 149" /LENGTH=294 /DNA_ID=CAMNT_0011552113 /DNA_START=66 /DNA_END=950 /DNA_ORIENTATION=-